MAANQHPSDFVLKQLEKEKLIDSGVIHFMGKNYKEVLEARAKQQEAIVMQARQLHKEQLKSCWDAATDSEAGNTILTFEKWYQENYGK
jgi:hypothetical protein